MIIKKWEDIPDDMKSDKVKKYYDILYKKRIELIIKRFFDIFVGILVLILLSPVFIIVSIAIKLDSKGPIMFRQVRVTQYGKQFRIYKFRTMIKNADKIGTQVTTKNDKRVTNVGKILREWRIDEIPQLFNIILGEMSFVGTRPEVVKYVERYTDEMKATLLLPAGVTSEASIKYKDEDLLLEKSGNTDRTYILEILPSKMEYNLLSLENFSFSGEVKTMLKTILAIVKRK
jgi:lipopolysaccharide/colanic/teichoic acid biosynthesis glycosyltransferase